MEFAQNNRYNHNNVSLLRKWLKKFVVEQYGSEMLCFESQINWAKFVDLLYK